MVKGPPPFIWASPEEKNILDCMFARTPNFNADCIL